MKTHIKSIFTNRIKEIAGLLLFCMFFSFQSCNDFLDIVPDNIPNLDHAFANKKEAENFLGTLYGHLPSVNPGDNILNLGADDVWTFDGGGNDYNNQAYRLARGEQNNYSPLKNVWEGNTFQAIRYCNIFIEEMNKPERVPEVGPTLRARWIAEAKILKAYYHFYLFRMYGPIPIMDTNIDADDDISKIRVKREPVDAVVDYMSDLIMEAVKDLPERIDLVATESGRLTQGAALTLRAKILTTAASPLFNGNPDYSDFVNTDGVHLFNAEFQQEKWVKAAKACDTAMQVVTNLNKLYHFEEKADISDEFRIQLSQAGAVWDRFNEELIWGRHMNASQCATMQIFSIPPHIDYREEKNTYLGSYYSVTLNMAERYYTTNGVPLSEDKEWNRKWNYANRYGLAVTDVINNATQKDRLQDRFTTSKINIDRESRYYGNLAFDGSLVYLKNVPEGKSDNAFAVKAKFGQANGKEPRDTHTTVSAIWMKKWVQWEFQQRDGVSNGAITDYFPWPALRLADLYLLAAECYNEIGAFDEAYHYIDQVRERAGLKGVVESWAQYSTDPNKPLRKDGLRDIIHQEREIELAFEGHRMWDLRRWKKAADFQNKSIMGWNVYGPTAGEFYQPTILFEQTFESPRDYFWPISIHELRKNPNLVQNPGW